MIADLRFAIGDLRLGTQMGAETGRRTQIRPPGRSSTSFWDVEKAKAGESSIHRPSGVANWLRNFTSISILSKTDC
jgi:hypothetical protein